LQVVSGMKKWIARCCQEESAISDHTWIEGSRGVIGCILMLEGFLRAMNDSKANKFLADWSVKMNCSMFIQPHFPSNMMSKCVASGNSGVVEVHIPRMWPLRHEITFAVGGSGMLSIFVRNCLNGLTFSDSLEKQIDIHNVSRNFVECICSEIWSLSSKTPRERKSIGPNHNRVMKSRECFNLQRTTHPTVRISTDRGHPILVDYCAFGD
jgi:hypothetical protein